MKRFFSSGEEEQNWRKEKFLPCRWQFYCILPLLPQVLSPFPVLWQSMLTMISGYLLSCHLSTGFVTVYIAYELHKLYPKQTVIELSEQIAGRFAGKIISLYILVFYILATGHIVRGYSEFIISSFLTNTPLIIITSSMVLLCAFAVQGGLEVLGRIAMLFSPLFVLPILSFVIFLSPDFEMKNIFPILEHGIVPVIKGPSYQVGGFQKYFSSLFFFPIYLMQKKRESMEC